MGSQERETDSGKSAPRTLGKLTAVLLTAAMIVGTGLFTSLGAATASAGSGILVAMLIGGAIALATGLSAAQAGVNYPEEGGAFIWLRDFDYPTVSFVAGCAYLTEGIVGLGILALGFATYSAQLFSGLPIPLVASIALLAVAAVNLFGITPTAKVLIGVFFYQPCLARGVRRFRRIACKGGQPCANPGLRDRPGAERCRHLLLDLGWIPADRDHGE